MLPFCVLRPDLVRAAPYPWVPLFQLRLGSIFLHLLPHGLTTLTGLGTWRRLQTQKTQVGLDGVYEHVRVPVAL